LYYTKFYYELSNLRKMLKLRFTAGYCADFFTSYHPSI